MLDEVTKVFAGLRSKKMPLRTEYKRVFVHVGSTATFGHESFGTGTWTAPKSRMRRWMMWSAQGKEEEGEGSKWWLVVRKV